MTQTPDTKPLSSPYQVAAGDPAVDRDNVLKVWHDCGFDTVVDHAAARYDWFYLQNPVGKALVNFLTTDTTEQRIGFLGVGPRNIYINGERHPAGVLVDFVVDPRHRIAMPALMLQRHSHRRALQSMVLLYGIPDTKAVAIMRRVGSHVSVDLPNYVRVLRTSQYLRRSLPSWCAVSLGVCVDSVDRVVNRLRLVFSGVTGEWCDAFDERFDRLWAALPKQDLCIGERNLEFLQWRFDGQVDRRYRIFTVRPSDSNELCSYFVCECSQGALIVKDCLHVGSAKQLQDGLLLLCASARRLGVASVSLQVTPIGDLQHALHATFFRQRSKRVVVAVTNESVRERCIAARWYVTPADEDV